MTVSQRGTPVIATGTTSVTGTWPTGSSQTKGDLLVAVVGAYGSTTNAAGATPAGWTQVENTYNFVPPDYIWVGIYVKVATGGDTAPTFTTTATGSTNIACVLYDLDDSSGLTPQIVTGGDNFGTSGTITVTTVGNVPSSGCFAISGAICANGTTSATTTWTTPSGWSLGGDQTTSGVSQLASYYRSGPASGSTLSCLFTHSRTSNVQVAASIVAQPPAAGGLAVTATQGGGTFEGGALTVKVLTGASGTPVGTTGTATGATANVSITPAATGSWIYGAITDANNDGAWTAEGSTTLTQSVQDNYNVTGYATFRSTSTTTGGMPVTVGATNTLTGGGIAAVEIQTNGTLAEDASSPVVTWTASATSIGTFWFVPPPGSLLVAMVSLDSSASQVTATVSDTLGLTWTQVASANTAGDGYAGVWTAVVPATPVWLSQAVRPRLPVRPAFGAGLVYGSLTKTGDTSFGSGRTAWNAGAPVNNPTPGPVFRQRTNQRRPRGAMYLPRPGGVYGSLTPGTGDTSFGTGRIAWNTGAPVQNPASPSPFYPAVQAIRARLPRHQFYPRGRAASNPGAPVRNPQPGPVFRQAVQPCRARIPQTAQPAAERINHSPGAPVRNPQPGPLFRQAVQAARARLPEQPFLKGRCSSSPGAPVRNPTPGPVFRQRVTPARFTLPPWQPRAGRIGSNPGAPVANPIHGPPAYAPLGPSRARVPQNAPRGRVYTTAKPAAAPPTPGPVFTQAPQAVRARLPQQPFLRGRSVSNAGAPVHNPTSGPVFRQAVHPAQVRIPQVFSRGRAYRNPGAPVRNPAPGPVFTQRVTPARAVIPQTFSKGRASGNPGAPVRNPSPGPVVYPALGPARARLPQLAPRAGRTGSNPGAPVANPPHVGPVFRPAVQAIRAKPPLRQSPAGLIYASATAVTYSDVYAANYTGYYGTPSYSPLSGASGRISFSYGTPPRNPVPGPVFRQATAPARIRPALPPRGHLASNPGGPLPPPGVTGPPFFPFRFPARARIPQNAPRGRILANPGAPVRNPHPGPVFPAWPGPVQARFPQLHPRAGRIGSNTGTPPAPPTPGPVFRPAVQALRAKLPVPFLKGRVLGNQGGPVHNPVQGPVFRQAGYPIRPRIPQTFPKGRIGSSPGAPPVIYTQGPAFRQRVTPARATIPQNTPGQNYSAVPLPPGVTHAGSSGWTSAASGTTVTATYASHAGGTLIALIAGTWGSSQTSTLSSVTDDAGNNWTFYGATGAVSTNYGAAYVAYCINASPVTYVTATWTTAINNAAGIDVEEFADLPAGAVLDGLVTDSLNRSGVNSYTTPPITTTGSRDIIGVALAGFGGWANWTPGTFVNPWTAWQIAGPGTRSYSLTGSNNDAFAYAALALGGVSPPAIAAAFSTGRISFSWGGPVRNPASGPLFRQATTPARIRSSLPPRGRAGSGNPGAPVRNAAPVYIGPIPLIYMQYLNLNTDTTLVATPGQSDAGVETASGYPYYLAVPPPDGRWAVGGMIVYARYDEPEPPPEETQDEILSRLPKSLLLGMGMAEHIRRRRKKE